MEYKLQTMKVLPRWKSRTRRGESGALTPRETIASQSSPRAAEAEAAVAKLRGEIRRTCEGRYLHRVHAVLLVLQGLTCSAAAGLLGAPPRTIAEWVSRFRCAGLDGLKDKAPPGRLPRLTAGQLAIIRERATYCPENARALSKRIAREFQVRLEIRQCQRLLKKLQKPV